MWDSEIEFLEQEISEAEPWTQLAAFPMVRRCFSKIPIPDDSDPFSSPAPAGLPDIEEIIFSQLEKMDSLMVGPTLLWFMSGS